MIEELKISNDDCTELVELLDDIGLFFHLMLATKNCTIFCEYDCRVKSCERVYKSTTLELFQKIINLFGRYGPYTDSLIQELRIFVEIVEDVEDISIEMKQNILEFFDTVQVDLQVLAVYANKNNFVGEFEHKILLPMCAAIKQLNNYFLPEEEIDFGEMEFF